MGNRTHHTQVLQITPTRTYARTHARTHAHKIRIQWHAERPQFEFSISADEKHINHGTHAVLAMQAVGTFFISEARRNAHAFSNATEEAAKLIYNDQAKGPLGDSYRAYIF